MSSTYPPFGGTPAQACQRCGRRLPLNESYCENCGYNNAPAQGGNSARRMPPDFSQQSWNEGYNQGQGGGQSSLQWGQLPVPSIQNGFPGQQPKPSVPSMPTTPPSNFPNQSFMPPPGGQNSFPGQFPSVPSQNSFAGLPPLPAPTQDRFSVPPDVASRQNGFAGFPQTPPSQSSFVGQPSFPPQSGASGFFNAPAQPMNSGNPFAAPAQPMNGGNPFAAPAQPGNNGNSFNGSGRSATGNLYNSGASSPAFNSSAMPNNFRSGQLSNSQPISFPRRERRGPGAGIIVGLVLLVIVLIGGGITGYILLWGGNGTPTGNTSPQSSTAPKETPLFADTFSDNNNGWNLQSDPGKFSATIGHGAMVLDDNSHNMLWELVPGNKSFSNFKLFVDATLSKGDQNNGYGVFIRGASNQNSELATYYRFSLYGDGTYAIFKGTVDANGNSTSTMLQSYAPDPAIKKSGVNHIIVVANGSVMSFFVNGQALKTVIDTGYTSGSVALFVINLTPSKTEGQATFTNFGIYPIKA